MSSEVFDTKKLDAFIKAISGDLPKVKVGVLGSGNIRLDGAEVNSNATIGMKHEFGMDGLPVRSFLRMPLNQYMFKYLESANAFTPEALNQVILDKSIKNWVQKVGVVAETVIADAFHTGGFGQWKPSNMKFKKNHETLVESQQLRNSITSEVEGD